MNLVSLPIRWLRNIIVIQEKKHYNFYVIFIFAAFVGIVRYFLEFILGWREAFVPNLSVVAFIGFYFFTIFGYTTILKICIPDFEWKKSIHLVLIGVFLGIFPPILDALFTGLGSFSYRYPTDPNAVRDIWFENLPAGELITLFLTMFFTSLVIFIKTQSFLRALIGFILTYGFIYLFGMLLPAYVVGGIKEIFLPNTESLQQVGQF